MTVEGGTTTVAPAAAPTASAPRPVSGPAAASHPRISHRPALDGLRGLAVIGVLLFHGGLLRGGFLGVDLFFVLSGYLITALLLVEVRDRGRIDLAQFWLRRAKRLLPAVLALLVAVSIYSRFAVDPLQWTAIRNDGLATLFYAANWHTIFSGATYGADLAGRSPLEHTWSLAIEEQFYVVWPLVVAGLMAIRRHPRVIWWASMVVAVVGSTSMIGLSFAGVSQNTLYLSTLTRMGAIGFGAVLASSEAARNGRPLSPGARQLLDTGALVAGALVLVAWGTVGLHDQFLYRGGLAACGIAVAIVIWSVVQPEPGVLGRALAVAPLRGFGFISYGLYLWHWPVFLWLDESRVHLRGWPLFLVRCIVSIALAVVSYEVVEQPIRRSRLTVRSVFPLAALGAVVASVALVASAVGAPTDPLTGGDRPVYSAASGSAPTLAVYGDSVAYLLGTDALAPLAEDLGVSVIDVARLGCEPLGGITIARDGNRQPVWERAWRNCIDALPVRGDGLDRQPDVAMVLFGGMQWDARIDGTWRHPCDAEYQEAYTERLTTTVATLRAAATPVVVVRPAPILARRLADLKGISDGADRADCLWKGVSPALAQAKVPVVDLQARYCTSSSSCDKIAPDREVRTDGIHYRGSSAQDLARWLVPEVLRAAGS